MKQEYQIDPEATRGNIKARRKKESEESARKSKAQEFTTSLCDSILSTWQLLTGSIKKQLEAEQDPGMVEEQRKMQNEKRFFVWMCAVLFLGEMFVGGEFALSCANWIASVFKIEPNTALNIASSVLIPAAIIVLLICVKKISNPEKTKKGMKEVDQALKVDAITEDEHEAQYNVHSRKLKWLYAIKWGYLLVITGFYFMVWSAIRMSEAQLYNDTAPIPELDEAVFSKELSEEFKSLAQPLENTGLPHSTLISAAMMIIIVGHGCAVFGKTPRWKTPLPFGKYDPGKHKKLIDQQEQELSSLCRGLIQHIDDEKDEELREKMVMLVNAPIRRIVNESWGSPVFPTDDDDDFPQLPAMRPDTTPPTPPAVQSGLSISWSQAGQN